jgi:hypothetical protein
VHKDKHKIEILQINVNNLTTLLKIYYIFSDFRVFLATFAPSLRPLGPSLGFYRPTVPLYPVFSPKSLIDSYILASLAFILSLQPLRCSKFIHKIPDFNLFKIAPNFPHNSLKV